MLNELFKSKLSGTVEPTEGISQSSTGIRKKKDGSLIVPIICSSKEKADKSLEDNPTLPDDVGKTKNNKVCTDNEQPNPKDSEITSSLPAVSPTIVDIIPCENRYEGIKLKLPKGWEEKDGWIYSNGKPATEFIIRSKSRRTHTSRNGESKLTVRCDLIAKDKKAEIDIPYDDLQNGKFKKHLPDGFVVFNVLDKPLEKLLCNSMLQTMADLPNEKTTCFSFGYNIINGQHIFNTGDRLINGEEINNWISTSDTIMKYVEPKPIDTYKKWISEFLESSNYPPVLLVAALVPYVFPLIDKSKRVHYEFGGYIVGKSGCGKTEIAKLLVTPFTDNCNMISLSSDRDAIHHMSAFNNCSVLFDDLNASDSDEIRRKKETKVSEIIETLQSVGKSVKEGKNTKIRALPFITAEYTLKRESLINRCLIVNIDKSFRPKSLTWLQENHDTYISFINSFIEFICKNYQMLHDYINNCLSSEKYHMKKNKGISGWTRVSNIKFVLDITLDILMAFLDIDCNKTISVFSYDNRFIESINKCVEYTLDLIKEQKKDKDEVIITKLLKDIWDPESEIVTTDKEHFLCGIKNNPDSLPEQFVIYQNKKHRFCLRAKDAARYLGHKTTNCTITKKLDNLGLIRAGKDRTKAVFKGETNAKFLCINEKSLANYLGVENEYLPPDIKDKTYKGCLGHSIMTNSGNYSAQTMPEQDETDYSDIETQMCDNSDDMSDNPILSFINECAAKKHHKKF